MASILAIGIATLTPIPEQAARSALTPFLCLACGETGGADLISNIALFLPLGLSLAALGLRGFAAAGMALTLSGLIEGMQYGLIAGRDASLSDVVANTVGAVLGWIIMAHLDRWLWPSARTARRLFVGWVAIVGATLAFTRWALESDLPAGTWYGQWATTDPESAFYSGHVGEVRLAGQRVPHWRLPDSLQRSIVRGSGSGVLLEATVVAGEGEADSRRILSLASDESRFLSLGTGAGDLSFWVRTRAARLRLISPRFRLPDGMKASQGETLHIGGRYAAGLAEVWSRGPMERSIEVRIGVLDPWLFLWPGPVPSGFLLWTLRLATLSIFLGPLWQWRVGFLAGRQTKTARL